MIGKGRVWVLVLMAVTKVRYRGYSDISKQLVNHMSRGLEMSRQIVRGLEKKEKIDGYLEFSSGYDTVERRGVLEGRFGGWEME